MTLLCPLSITLYIMNSIEFNRKWYLNLYVIVGFFLSTTLLFLEIVGIADLWTSLLIAALFIVIGCFHISIVLFYETIFYKNKRAEKELKVIIFFFVFVVVEIIYFFTNNHKVSYFMLTGAIIYIGGLLIYMMKNSKKAERLKIEKEVLKSIAFTDALTGALNRAAYIKDILDVYRPENSEYWTILMDTDKLKFINDNFGHEFGDMVIKDTCAVFNHALKGLGKVYRVGGDEFFSLVEKSSDFDVEKFIKLLEEKTIEINKLRKYDFSVSTGFAKFNPNINKDTNDTIARADNDMYIKKKKKFK